MHDADQIKKDPVETNDTPTPTAPPLSSESESKSSGFTINDRRFWALSEEELKQEAERPKLPTFVERLKNELEEKDKQLREYIAAYKKEVGEGLEKTKQRLERDAAMQLERLKSQIATPMLEVLDALERSLKATESCNDQASIIQGIKMVHSLMVQKLQEIGLTRIETMGQAFNPAVHEAVSVAEVRDPNQDNLVIAEFRPGFMLNNKVVRPSYVQVGKFKQLNL